MHEQFSSTTSTGAPARSASVDPEVAPCGRNAAVRFLNPDSAVRIGAVALGCFVLGAATCRHAAAQPNAVATRAASISELLGPVFSHEQPTVDVLACQPGIDSLSFSSSTAALQPNGSAPGPVETANHSIVTIVTEHRDSILPYRRIYHMSRASVLGQTNIAHQGVSGLLEKTYRVTYRADVPVAYEYQGRRVVKAPVDMVIDAGYTDRAARAMPSRSGLYTRAREIDMVATGYSPMEGSGSGRCANGMRAGYAIVAVDPRLIPLGSKLFIEGYGYALAGDTGGAIRGRRIDLGQNTYREASMVGRRKVHVYVLSDACGR